jgi:hypothetical protein
MFLSKPFDVDDLTAAVDSALATNGGPGSTGS